MSIRAPLLLIAALASGCAAPSPPPAAQAAPAPPLVSPSPQASAPPEARAAPPAPAPAAEAPEVPLPDRIALGSKVACSFDMRQWRGAADITELALRPGGPAFARINGGAAKVDLPVGAASTTLLTVEDGGLVVSGHAPAAALELRAAKPFVLEGFAIGWIFARLGFSEVAEGEITVTYAAPKSIEIVDAPLRGRRPCGDVSLEGGQFDAEESVPGNGEKKSVHFLAMDRPVPLSVEPGGKAAARIRVTEPHFTSVLEKKAGRARVLVAVDTLVLFGWVSTRDLVPAGDIAGYGTGSGHLGVPDPKRSVLERRVCAADVPVVAEIAEARATVGTIRKGTVIEVLERGGDLPRVWVKTRWIHPAGGATLRARASDLGRCRKVEDGPEVPSKSGS
jgi:hypothetical protein